jgi:hypothetical protein
MADLIKLIYQPPKKEGKTQDPHIILVPEAQAAKMLKMGRWKAAPKEAIASQVGQSSKK